MKSSLVLAVAGVLFVLVGVSLIYWQAALVLVGLVLLGVAFFGIEIAE